MALTLPGGILADWTEHHHRVMVGCLAGSAVMVALVGLGVLPFWSVIVALALGGGMRGLVTAARDVNVRHSAGSHSVGTVFAFVSTGSVLGAAVALPIYGLMLDYGSPQTVFLISAVMTLGAIGATLLHSRTKF